MLLTTRSIEPSRPHRRNAKTEFVRSSATAHRSDAEGNYPAGTWIRDPGGHQQDLFSADGCILFVKTGHLALAAAEVSRLAAAAGGANP
jgi:hypothetical protein